jgi:hypothetical protein
MPQRVVELLASWRGQFGSCCNLEIWRLSPLCLMWCIWRGHNARNFKDCEKSVLELKAIIKFLYVCVAAYNNYCFSAVLEYTDSCSSSP